MLTKILKEKIDGSAKKLEKDIEGLKEELAKEQVNSQNLEREKKELNENFKKLENENLEKSDVIKSLEAKERDLTKERESLKSEKKSNFFQKFFLELDKKVEKMKRKIAQQGIEKGEMDSYEEAKSKFKNTLEQLRMRINGMLEDGNAQTTEDMTENNVNYN